MNRADLQRLALMRLREAEALLAAGEPSGAFYLAGYAVECAFKARIASFTQAYDFPGKRKAVESYTHSFRELVRPANLVEELGKRLRDDPDFAADWKVVTSWNEESRYRESSREAAEELINAIEDSVHGVLPWLKLFW